MNRRQALASIGGTSIVLLSGCTGGFLGSDSTAVATQDNAETSPTASTAGSGPEAALRKYFTAVDNGNVQRITRLVVLDDTIDARALAQQHVTINTIRESSFSQVNAPGVDLQAKRQEIQGYVDREGYEAWTTVSWAVAFDGTSRQGHAIMVKDNNTWRVLLPNAATGLQTKAIATGEQSSQQVTSRVQVVTATGQVTDGTVTRLTMTVAPSPGASNIDLNQATVQWVGPDTTTTLTRGATADESHFTTTNITGTNGIVLDSPDDRIQLIVDLTAVASGAGLAAGEEATLTIVTQAGAETTYPVTVPDSLEGNQTISL